MLKNLIMAALFVVATTGCWKSKTETAVDAVEATANDVVDAAGDMADDVADAAGDMVDDAAEAVDEATSPE